MNISQYEPIRTKVTCSRQVVLKKWNLIYICDLIKQNESQNWSKMSFYRTQSFQKLKCQYDFVSQSYTFQNIYKRTIWPTKGIAYMYNNCIDLYLDINILNMWIIILLARSHYAWYFVTLCPTSRLDVMSLPVDLVISSKLCYHKTY